MEICSGMGRGFTFRKRNNECVSDSVIIYGRTIACMFAMYLLYSNQNTFIENAGFPTINNIIAVFMF